jgi:A/G-specific adenine glycosylase
MLQQTPIGRVVPFYRRFMARFPTPVALADTPATEALALWSGPVQPAGFASPGSSTVLRQTAGRPVRLNCSRSPELARTPRLSLRVLPSENRSRPRHQYATRPESLVRATIERPRFDRDSSPGAAPGRAVDWNQAIMDLGASVCRPAEPLARNAPSCSGARDPKPTQLLPPRANSGAPAGKPGSRPAQTGPTGLRNAGTVVRPERP